MMKIVAAAVDADADVDVHGCAYDFEVMLSC
jgi:hypothetical protein